MSTASPDPAFPPTQWIGILVFDGFEPIDVFGFAEAFTISRFLCRNYANSPLCVPKTLSELMTRWKRLS